MYSFSTFKTRRYRLESAAKKKAGCCKNDSCNNDSQQVEARIATAVAALACKYVYEQEDLTDYGNGVQNTAPEVAPRRERSVSLRQKHIRCFVIYFVFHVFSPFLRFAPKYYTYSIPLFSFFGKGFCNIFLFFSKKCHRSPQNAKNQSVYSIYATPSRVFQVRCPSSKIR